MPGFCQDLGKISEPCVTRAKAYDCFTVRCHTTCRTAVPHSLTHNTLSPVKYNVRSLDCAKTHRAPHTVKYNCNAVSYW